METTLTESRPEDIPPGPLRVMIVDDHPLVRQGLARLIEFEEDMIVVGHAGSMQEALDRIPSTSPHVAIIDISLTSESGIKLIREITARGFDIAMLVLSMHDEALYAERCIRAGAKGFVSKHEQPARIIEAVRRVAAGELHLSARAFEQLVRKSPEREGGRPGDLSVLTDREMQIFGMLGQGMTTRKIAEQLELSQTTVRTHRENIRQKLGIEDNARLIQFAVRRTVDGG